MPGWTECDGEALVTMLFEETNGKTTVRLTVRYASKEDADGALATPMAEGMEMGYARLLKMVG